MNKKQAKQLFRQADEFFRSGGYENALEILDHLDIAFPENRRVMYSLARCLAEVHRFDEALELCDSLIRRENHDKAIELKNELEIHLDKPAKAKQKKRGTDHEKHSEDARFTGYDDDALTNDELLVLADTTDGLITEEDLAGFADSNWRPPLIWLLVVAAFLVALGAAWITVSPSETGDTFVGDGPPGSFVERVDSWLYRIGPAGIVAVIVLFWIVNSAVTYGVLAVLRKLSSVDLAENLIDVLLFGLILSILLPIPLVGFILELLFLRQKYDLDLRGIGIFIAIQAGAYAVCGGFLGILLLIV